MAINAHIVQASHTGFMIKEEKKHQDEYQRTLFEIMKSSETLSRYRSIEKDYRQLIESPYSGT